MSKNLIDDFFSKNQGFEVAACCTFNINLQFFENYLFKLDGFAACDSISIFTDYSIYEAIACESKNYWPKWLNRKYLLTSIKANGIFHPKIYLMASEKRARIAIASANLTREGLTSNLEILSIFEISEKDGRYSNLLSECVEYFNRLANYSGSKAAQERMLELVDVTAKLIKPSYKESVAFIHNLDKPLLSQIQDIINDSCVKRIKVLSPFYDEQLRVISALQEKNPETSIEIYLQQGKSNFPVKELPKLNSKVKIFLFTGIERYMHGKLIALELEDRHLLFSGSANFTDSALLTSNFKGNVEVGLFGVVEKKIYDELFAPPGCKVQHVKSPELIKTTTDKEEAFFSASQSNVHYILEAVEQDGVLKLTTVKNIQFRAMRIILQKTNETLEIDFSDVVDLKKLSVTYKDVYAVQVSGYDGKDNFRLSNSAWIIRLEKKDDTAVQKKYRRILNSPFELIEVLNGIIATGDEDELKRFLLTFDIPLDLLLMPSQLQNFFRRESQGNVMGELVESNHSIFKIQDIITLFRYFLERLMTKLYTHYDNTQLQKLPNFLLIFATLFSMIEFIDTKVFNENKGKIVTAEKWEEIRECYNMLLHYVKDTWTLFWFDSKDFKSFRSIVNLAIADDDQQILGEVLSLEELIQKEYLFLFKKALEISADTIKNFSYLKETLKVKTVIDTIVKPSISPRDIYISDIPDIYNMLVKCQFYKI